MQSLEHVKRLRHTYVMPIHAFWVHKDQLHIAMELADGSLSDRAAHYRKQGVPGIPQEELLRYMRETAEALDFLHAEGIHHRDIKPANILLLKGHVKVADFGLVRPLREADSIVNATFCGTPTYMPPEVWENKISAHSDQWSLAVSYL
jgi:serine/threonine protein kinase